MHNDLLRTCMVAFDPSLPGIYIFGLIAGICPCNSVLCLGLVTILMYGVGLSIPLIIISSLVVLREKW